MRYEYIEAMKLRDKPFYALIMAAMVKADTVNLVALKIAFPDVWLELQLRYHATNGYLSAHYAKRFGK